MSNNPPIKKQQPANEKNPGEPKRPVERNPLAEDDGDIRKNEDATGDNLDADLYESMEDDMERGKGGLNRGLGDLGDMQGDTDSDIDEEYEDYEDGEIYDDKADDVNY
jgi:hypothetical protein